MQMTPQPRKGFQSLGFDGVLSPPFFRRRKKGGRRRHSAGDADYCDQLAHRPAMTGFGKYRLKTPAEFSKFS